MLNLEQVRQFLYYEARLLDDRSSVGRMAQLLQPAGGLLDAGVGRR